MTFEVLDPTFEEGARGFSPAPRLTGLEGATIGVVSNGKQGTRPFFDALAEEFRGRYGAAEVVRVVKANYSAPAEAEVMDRAREWTALVAGVGD